jgi:hypothetical protein
VDNIKKFFICSITAIVFLLSGAICLLHFVDLKNSPDLVSLAKSLSLYAMVFLTMGLFYEKNSQTWEKTPINLFMNLIGKCCLFAFVLLIVISLVLSQGTYLAPIFMALIAIGLYCSNLVFSTKFEPNEQMIFNSKMQFFKSYQGNLLLFLIGLALLGAMAAGFQFIINFLF